MTHHYITTQSALVRACAALRIGLAADPRLAVDTEFVGERSYEPLLELVQVSAAGGPVFLIDVRALDDRLDPLAELLLDPTALKVVHAGGQDVGILRSYLGAVPGPIFDTQIAASYVGYPLQLGYGQIVRTFLRVDLAKDEGFADWTRRPITPAMLEYAANDVRHLHGLHDKLSERLQRLGRREWVDEACAAMVSNAGDVAPQHELWRKVGGRSSLDRKQLAVLRELCIWRDEEAQRRNKPRRSVLKDDVLVEIARRKPSTARAIMELRNAPPNMGERTATELVARVRAGLEVPPERHPEAEDSISLDDQGGALYELLSAVVKVRAIDMEIAPTLLAPGEQLKQVAALRRVDPDNILFRSWRDELIGRHLRATLAGELSVAWDAAAGRLVLR